LSDPLAEALSGVAWTGAQDSSSPWEFGVLGGESFTLEATPLDGSALPNGRYVAVTEHRDSGWNISIADAKTGTVTRVAEGVLPNASFAIGRVSDGGEFVYVAESGPGATGEVDRIDSKTGARTVALQPRAAGPELTVFQMSSSNVLLHSFCTHEACHSAIVLANGTVIEFDDIFPVAATATAVLAAADSDGVNWVVVDAASGKATPLSDQDDKVKRPLSVVVPLDDGSFAVDNGTEILRVESDGSLSVLLSAEAHDGWQLGQAVVAKRWITIRPVDRATGPRLSERQRREVSVIDLETGTVSPTVAILPVAP
jgi:DNA-binding beta-propeller fold protein YncE